MIGSPLFQPLGVDALDARSGPLVAGRVRVRILSRPLPAEAVGRAADLARDLSLEAAASVGTLHRLQVLSGTTVLLAVQDGRLRHAQLHAFTGYGSATRGQSAPEEGVVYCSPTLLHNLRLAADEAGEQWADVLVRRGVRRAVDAQPPLARKVNVARVRCPTVDGALSLAPPPSEKMVAAALRRHFGPGRVLTVGDVFAVPVRLGLLPTPLPPARSEDRACSSDESGDEAGSGGESTFLFRTLGAEVPTLPSGGGADGRAAPGWRAARPGESVSAQRDGSTLLQGSAICAAPPPSLRRFLAPRPPLPASSVDAAADLRRQLALGFHPQAALCVASPPRPPALTLDTSARHAPLHHPPLHHPPLHHPPSLERRSQPRSQVRPAASRSAPRPCRPWQVLPRRRAV